MKNTPCHKAAGNDPERLGESSSSSETYTFWYELGGNNKQPLHPRYSSGLSDTISFRSFLELFTPCCTNEQGGRFPGGQGDSGNTAERSGQKSSSELKSVSQLTIFSSKKNTGHRPVISLKKLSNTYSTNR